MSFLRPLQDFDSPKLGEEFYQALVVDNNDPNKLGRVKIRIVELHGTEQEISNDNLPWAIQFRPSFLGGKKDLSNFSIPRIGSQVMVTHIRGEIYQPAYMFELSHNNNRITKKEEDYPESYGFIDSDSNFWHVNMVQDKLNILFNGTQYIEITVDNNETIGQDQTLNVGRNKSDTVGNNETRNISNDKSETIGNNLSNNIGNNETRNIGNNFTETVTNTHTQNSTIFNINTSGDTNITASGNVNVDASSINLNGSSDGVLTTKSINPLTGTPFPDGSTTVFAGDG